MKIANLRKNGFTLIELLIVIAILAGLATLFLSTFPAAQKRGRDARRKSDLKQYQTSLEIYANRTGNYPNANGNLSGQCSALGLTGCPDDPRPSNERYKISSDGQDYVIWSRLEAPAAATSPYYVICSNGKIGENQTASGPACPLP